MIAAIRGLSKLVRNNVSEKPIVSIYINNMSKYNLIKKNTLCNEKKKTYWDSNAINFQAYFLIHIGNLGM